MTVRIGVVAHQARADQAHELQETVAAVYLNMDDGSLGCDKSHRKVWSWLADHDGGADWLLVLEDDAAPCDNFRKQLDQALATAPTPVVSLYLGRERPTWAQKRIAQATATDACWLTSRHLYHAVAVAIHTPLVPHMLTHSPKRQPIDQAISSWAKRHHHPIAYTHPSLVDHRDQPTLAHHPDRQPRQPGRVAWCHGTRPTWGTTVHEI